jgi:hypothetical protein
MADLRLRTVLSPGSTDRHSLAAAAAALRLQQAASRAAAAAASSAASQARHLAGLAAALQKGGP